MEYRKKIFSNFIALGTGEALSRLVAFAATIYLARLLGAESYGVIAFAMAVNLYLIKISEFALEWVGTEEAARSPSDIAELASALLAARLVLTLFLITLSGIVIQVFLPEPEHSVMLIYLLVLLPTALNTKWVHIGIEDSKPVGLSRVIGEALSLLFILSLVRDSSDLWVAPVAQTIGEFFISLFLVIVLRQKSYKFRLSWNMSIVLPIFKKSFPLVSHILLGLFIYNSDMIFLRFFHNSESVGLYSIAYVLISFTVNIGLTYGMSLTPAFTHMETGGKEESSFYQTILAQIFTITLPISIGGYLFASNIILFAFGNGYEDSIQALQILIWTIPFSIFRNAPWVALIARNKQNLLFKAISIAAVANIILNLSLIPSYGVTGAAIATILTEFLVSALMLYFAVKEGLPFVSLTRFTRPILAGSFMALTLWLMSPVNLFIGIITGTFLYLTILYVTGCIQYKKGSLPVLNV